MLMRSYNLLRRWNNKAPPAWLKGEITRFIQDYQIRVYQPVGHASLLVGVSMSPHGEVALVIAVLGFAQGHISHHVLVAFILMTIGAALMGPLLMARLARSLV